MGREGVLPRSIFAYLDPRYSTPTRSIYLMGAVSLIGAMAVRFQLAAEVLNFGAFVGFILVNLSVIRHFYIRLGERLRICLFTHLLFPLARALVCSSASVSL